MKLKVTHQTKDCIRCRKPAVLWTGFVEDRDRRPVLAGWCGKGCMYHWNAYHGEYRAWMGKTKA